MCFISISLYHSLRELLPLFQLVESLDQQCYYRVRECCNVGVGLVVNGSLLSCLLLGLKLRLVLQMMRMDQCFVQWQLRIEIDSHFGCEERHQLTQWHRYIVECLQNQHLRVLTVLLRQTAQILLQDGQNQQEPVAVFEFVNEEVRNHLLNDVDSSTQFDNMDVCCAGSK